MPANDGSVWPTADQESSAPLYRWDDFHEKQSGMIVDVWWRTEPGWRPFGLRSEEVRNAVRASANLKSARKVAGASEITRRQSTVTWIWIMA
jgi:hypothetical protein